VAQPKFPRLLVSLPGGRVVEHPVLLAPVRSADDVGVPGPDESAIPLPAGVTLANLPGQRPIGIDPDTGETVVLREVIDGGKKVRPDAVAAVLPPGYTRTYLPVGHRTPLAPMLPQWAYAAAGWDEKAGLVVHALHTDRRTHWSTEEHSTPELQGLVAARQDESRLTKQLAKCALEYRCFTAQNIFYARDEGAIPASVGCNAKCVGCISEQVEGEGIASHERMDGPPTSEEMAVLGIRHLRAAEESQSGRAMVSFGQGCEGEPLTRGHHIAKAIRLMRAETSRGSININTNGSRPAAMQLLVNAGLDACRVSLNSALKPLYEAYYRPVDYTWERVRETLSVARDAGVYIALNLLSFPGITDREGEVEALSALIGEFGVRQVQTRNLALDPEQYLAVARPTAHASEALGIAAMIRRLKKDHPKLVIGNFARGLSERGDWSPRAVTSTQPSSEAS
jgi:pyruvate-formate lyase-activating enzyme